MPEFPMKEWNVKLYILDQDGNKHPASCFNKVVYNLHPSFENPQQSRSTAITPKQNSNPIAIAITSTMTKSKIPTQVMLTVVPTTSISRTPLHLHQRGLGRV